MLTYEELMRRRRIRRAKAMVKYSVMDGVSREEAEKIANAYLRGELEYSEALKRIYRLVEKYKKPHKKRHSAKQKKEIQQTKQAPKETKIDAGSSAPGAYPASAGTSSNSFRLLLRPKGSPLYKYTIIFP